MAKKNLYCVEAKEKSESRDCLWFKKIENGGIEIQLDSSTGTFSVKENPARTGINPATKQKIEIPAKKVAKFKAGAELSSAVN